MSKNEEKLSCYYYPDTKLTVVRPNKEESKTDADVFNRDFNELDLSKCSEDLKQYLLRMLKKSRRKRRMLRKASKLSLESSEEAMDALDHLWDSIAEYIDTDIDHIQAKRDGLNNLSRIYSNIKDGNRIEIEIHDYWDKVLTRAIRKLGGE